MGADFVERLLIRDSPRIFDEATKLGFTVGDDVRVAKRGIDSRIGGVCESTPLRNPS